MNGNFLGNEFSNITAVMETDVKDVRTLATSYLMYQIGQSFLILLQTKQN